MSQISPFNPEILPLNPIKTWLACCNIYLEIGESIMKYGIQAVMPRPQLNQIRKRANPKTTRPRLKTQALFPLFDIHETDSHYLISFDMPHVLGSDVDVKLTDDELIISGKGGLGRDFQDPMVSLRVQSSTQTITARYEQGMLVIALPKDEIF